MKSHYLVPPKLRQKLLIAGGLTVWELLILLALGLLNMVRHQYFAAFFLPISFLAVVIRIFDGKSLKDLSLILLRYHFTPQFFSKALLPTQQKKGKKHYEKRPTL